MLNKIALGVGIGIVGAGAIVSDIIGNNRRDKKIKEVEKILADYDENFVPVRKMKHEVYSVVKVLDKYEKKALIKKDNVFKKLLSDTNRIHVLSIDDKPIFEFTYVEEMKVTDNIDMFENQITNYKLLEGSYHEFEDYYKAYMNIYVGISLKSTEVWLDAFIKANKDERKPVENQA